MEGSFVSLIFLMSQVNFFTFLDKKKKMVGASAYIFDCFLTSEEG